MNGKGRKSLPLEAVRWLAAISVLLWHVMVGFELAPDGLHRRMSGRVAHHLGVLSLPLYLVHIPVLCSLGCMTLIAMTPLSSALTAAIAASGVTIAGSLAVSIAFALFNERWVAFINRAVDRLLEPSAPEGRAPSRSERVLITS
jgi:peptidoglycan/LPS O-acetylase OafA/YrhL